MRGEDNCTNRASYNLDQELGDQIPLFKGTEIDQKNVLPRNACEKRKQFQNIE